MGLAQRTKPSAEGRHFLLFELRSSVSWPPEGGLNHRDRRGTPESHGWRGFGLPNVISQDYPVVSEDYIARGQGMTQKRFVQVDAETGELIEEGFVAYVAPRRQNGFGKRWFAMAHDAAAVLKQVKNLRISGC